jgi:nitroimidazol reductase NimA-like FMN-containing flavoprotein (pyridoxamine 5'-phosphate oxidase superfamily)
MSTEVTELSPSDCELLLAMCDVGRIAVVEDGYPLVFPINYRAVMLDTRIVLAIRTRADNVIDHPGRPVCFESTDAGHDGGWSVLVAVARRVVADPDSDPNPIDANDRDAWRIIVPRHVSGRRVQNRAERWSFHPAGYL